MVVKDGDYLTAADVGKMLDLVPASIRQMSKRGDIPFIRTKGGVRLFHRNDVMQLMRRRSREKRRNG